MNTPFLHKQLSTSSYDDTGYTKVCPRCVLRYGNKPYLRGKNRDVTLVLCVDCVKKPVAKSEKKYLSIVKEPPTKS